MSVREKENNQKTFYQHLLDHGLNLHPIATVRQLENNLAVCNEPLSCPSCGNKIYTGGYEHLYTQYAHYECKMCKADLIFIAFGDHPDGKDYKLANLVTIN